jgi:hypothetical protein
MNRYDTPAPTELLEQVQRLGLDAHIKRRDGLVADDERRVQRDDTGGGHPFGTDRRTARWDGAVDRRVEADHVEQLSDAAPQRRTPWPSIVGSCRVDIVCVDVGRIDT